MLFSKGYSLLCYVLVISSGIAFIHQQNQNRFLCHIKNSKWDEDKNSSCKESPNSQDCVGQNEGESDPGVTNGIIEVSEVERKTDSTVFNVSFPVKNSGTVLLVINNANPYADEHTEDSKQAHRQVNDTSICLQIRLDDINVNSEEFLSVHIDGLEFSNGEYNFTAFISQEARNNGYDHLLKSVFAWKILSVRSEPELPEKSDVPHHREVLNKNVENCPCCINISYNYVYERELLEFFYSFPEGPCHKDFHVQLYNTRDASVDSEEECLAQNDRAHKVLAITKISLVGGPRVGTGNTTETVTIAYPSIPGGCYIFRTVRGHYHDFIWLQPLLVDSWNTTIFIVPDASRRSLNVSWHQPDFPFNFTTWKVKLLYLAENTFDCRVRNNTSVHTNSSREHILNETFHTFENLSDGFYCVWLNSGEGRSRNESWRTSTTVFLSSKPEENTEEVYLNYLWIAFAIGATILSVVIVLLSLLFFKLFYLKHHRKGSYSSVTQLEAPLETIPVLIIWTKLFEDRKEEFKKVVQAFKELLRTYSKCEVYDYMDYASLNNKEKQQLMMDPVRWLHEHFQNSREKIIFVESSGVPTRPGNGEISSEKIHQKTLEGFDEIDYKLFPLAIRYLKDSVELSTDYSKVFCVRFKGVHSQKTDAAAIVPLMRYTIPDHMRKLTLNLRGLDKDSCFYLQPPPEKLVEELQSLINSLR